jgi:leucyl aminopeptidase (aminopeptidase T)
MNQEQLYNYARLLLKVGVNLQPKQDLVINAEIEAKDLVEALTILAYKEFQSMSDGATGNSNGRRSIMRVRMSCWMSPNIPSLV